MTDSSRDVGITLSAVTRSYRIYHSPARRLLDALWPSLRPCETTHALRDITLDFAPGERVGIIGFNGSGKTTLLKLIAGLITPSAGTLAVRGAITALFSHGSAFRAELTGRENIFREARLHGMNPQQIERKLAAIVAFSELGQAIDAPLHTYSTGMVARLGLSVLAHLQAEVLLVDEVLSGGDLYFQEKAFRAMQELCRRGKLVLIVSHDMEVILRACNRVVWLDKGRIIADGAPWDVCWQYYREVYFDHWHRLNEEVVELAKKIPRGELRGHLLSAERHWGSGEMRFTRVDFVDSEGRSRSCFRTGESLRIQLHYEARRRLPRVALLVDVRTPLQVLMCSAYSHLADFCFEDVDGEGIMEVAFPHLLLGPGRYAINFGAYPAEDGLDFSRYYAHHSILLGNEAWFEVEGAASDQSEPGAGREHVVSLPHHWELS